MNSVCNPAGESKVVPGRTSVWLIIGITLLLSLLLRMPGLDGTLWIDEAGSIAQASAPDFWAKARQDVHPPLYHVMLRAGLRYTSSVPLLRMFSVVCGVALAALATWSMRSSSTAAIVAGAIGATLPELLHHSQQLRPYAMLFLLLGTALALAASGANGKSGRPAQFSLSLVLLAAAATHLITGFFLLALVPLLWWPVRARPGSNWLTCFWPLLPAGLLLLWFKFSFVTQPGDMAEGWWIPVTTTRTALAALGEATGWDNVMWLANASGRRLMLAIWGVPLLAAAALAISFSTAWGHLRGGPLKWLLLVSALAYLTALLAYSVLLEPIVMARTLLPGLLPLGVGLAWGIGHHPRSRQRWIATIAIVVYLALAVMPVIRRAYSPIAGLRGLAETLRMAHRTDDTIILFRAMDYGLAPYWPQLADERPLQLDTTRPMPPQLLTLKARLNADSSGGNVWLAYRDDYYFRRNRTAYDAVCEEIAAHHRTLRVFWQENDLTLLLAEPMAGRPGGTP